MKISKILFASDLHGSDYVFKHLISVAISNKVDAVLIGGDISGKTLRPIIKKADGTCEATFLGKTKIYNQGSELVQLQQDIANSGSYSILIDDIEYIRLERDGEYRGKLFLQQMKIRLSQWIAYAEEKLRPKNIQFLIICGNDDHLELDEIIAKSNFAQNPEKEVVKICDFHEVIGESYANRTPFKGLPRDVDDKEVEKRLRNKIQNIVDIGKAIFLIHVPPKNSGLDNAPVLDETLKPIVVGGNSVIEPVGSDAVRKIIEEFQPMLTLHGHIHESSGFSQIGRTYCFNPGSEYSNAFLRAYLITLDRDSVKGHFLIRI